jgi:hypothetical protein
MDAKSSTGTLNVATGSLGLLIVDVAGNGILGLNPGGNPFLRPENNPGIPSQAASLRVGGSFGGDRVVARMSADSNGTLNVFLPSFNIFPFLGKPFAIVWFDQIQNATAPTVAPIGSKYGVVRGSDWFLPAIDSGGYSFLPNDDNGARSFYQVSLDFISIPPIGYTTITGEGNPAASFTVVPETNTLILASVASLFLIRRRRNQALTVIE